MSTGLGFMLANINFGALLISLAHSLLMAYVVVCVFFSHAHHPSIRLLVHSFACLFIPFTHAFIHFHFVSGCAQIPKLFVENL